MRRATAAAAVGTLLMAGAVPALATAQPAAPLQRLTSTAVAGLLGALDLGPVPAGTPMQVAVTLARPSAGAEQAYLHQVEDPVSPSYRHYLTPSQFNARFGVAQGAYDVVRRFATAYGLRAVSEVGSRDYLLLAGPAGAVNRTFGVAEHRFTSLGVEFVASRALPAVPAGLGITGVLGLDSVHHANLSRPAPQQDTCVAGTCTGALNISDLWSAYDMPDTARGAGQTMAVFGEGEVKPVISDLAAFEAKYHLPKVPLRVRSVGDDFKDTSGTGEWDLDTQSSTGTANLVKEEVLYFGKDLSDASVNATYAAWADDPAGPRQANASFGECEPIAGGPSTPIIPVPGVGGVGIGTQSIAAFQAQEAQLRKARAEGRTLFASAGDQGGSCAIGIPNFFENNGVPALNVPAASVNAVGVGGTVLYTDGSARPRRVVERALDATGGGSSPSIHADSYQQGTPSLVPLTPCVVHQDGTPDTSGALCRSLPDVSADSGDITVAIGQSGLNIISNGQPTAAAGTSLSSPVMMGIWARIQGAVAARAPQGLGFANLTWYRLGKGAASYPQTFYDVTLGGNGQRVATPGYDQASGFGVPDVAHVIAAVTPAAPLRAAPVRPAPPVAVEPAGRTTSRAAGEPAAATGGRLAATGLSVALPVIGLALLVGAAIVRRRRSG